jgi:hypothetical protein
MEKPDNNINRLQTDNMGAAHRMSQPFSTANLPAAFPYKNPTDPEYPVIAYNNDLINLFNHPVENVPIEDLMKETLDSIRNCGFNATVLAWNKKPTDWRTIVRDYYREAESRGLTTILDLTDIPLPAVNQNYASGQGSSLSRNPDGVYYTPSLDSFEEDLNRDSDVKNLWGFCMRDKPEFISWGYDYVTAPLDTMIFGGTADLCEAYRIFMQNMNRHTAFLNLSVSMERKYVGPEIYERTGTGTSSLGKYLDAITNRFHPTLMSAEVFPVIKSDTPPYLTVADWYYSTLEEIGRHTRMYNAKCWIYMPTVAFKVYHKGSTAVETEYPLPTVEMLRYQALTAIALGVQGLVFWAYALPENVMQHDSESGASIPKKEYTNAPYNEGVITQIWKNCAAVIPEIKLFGKVLLNAQFLEARHFYGSDYVRDKFPDTFDFTSYMGCVAYAAASGRGCLISRLDKANERYVAIVSHDPANSQELTLTMCAGCRWTEYVILELSDGSLTERVHASVGYEAKVNRTLKPGGILLFKYEWV